MSFPLTLTWRSGNNLSSKEDLSLRWATMVPMEAHMGCWGMAKWNGKGNRMLFRIMIYLNIFYFSMIYL
jgi:hypothetical protein